MILRSTCTEKLQTFHKPSKEYSGSPLKCDNMTKKASSSEQDGYCDPCVLDHQYFNKDQYNERVINQAINFAASNQTNMPFLRTFKLANLYASIWDHNYTNIDPEGNFLNELRLITISKEEILKIEAETRDQANSNAWHEYRRYRITASIFHKSCLNRTKEEQKKIAHSIVYPKQFKTKATDWGRKNEPVALEICRNAGFEIIKCGFFISESNPYLGASPDGLIGDDTIVEIKCPHSCRSLPMNEKTVPYLFKENDGTLKLKPTHVYYYQTLGQLYVTGRSIALFIIHSKIETMILTIQRDQTMIDGMIQQLRTFYKSYFKLFLIEEFVYKRYNIIFPDDN